MEAKNIQLNICYSCMNRMPEESSVCSACGNDNGARSNPENTLPEGTVLFRKYLVGKVIGRGGFGITYIGYDLDLQLKVAIKEYFPAGVSYRSSRSYDVISDTSSSSQNHTAFSKGCEAFLDEARMLASVNSPYIVHVRDFFREHGTALPLIEQLDKLHEKNIIHRDIKPENIMLVKDWFGVHLILLDFGAARSFISGNVSKTFTAVVTPGFAPPEQYSQKSRQGAFTDVYGLCATMYYAITGTIPPTATERSAEDIPIRSFRSFGLDVPQHIERAIIHGLALKSSDRTQTMQELYAELSDGVIIPNSGLSSQETASRTPARHAASRPSSHTQQRARNTGRVERRTRKSGWRKVAVILLALFIVAFAGTSAVYLLRSNSSEGRTDSVVNEATSTSAPDITATPTSQPTAVPTEIPDALILKAADIAVGDHVIVGSYEQDNDLTNGPEPIEWIVLDKDEVNLLLVSRYALDCQQYNKDNKGVIWTNSTLYNWLNGTDADSFVNRAFSNFEQKMLYEKGNNGKVFLLSMEECENYYKTIDERKCEPTAYAVTQGVQQGTYKTSIPWWTRSKQSDASPRAYLVDSLGRINKPRYVNRKEAVRPAVWINVAAITEKSYSVEANTQGLTDVHVGDYVSFGSYDQDLNRTNGKESIDWLVLDIKDNKALLLSRYLFDSMQYWAASRGVTWETGKLRTWLNQSFLQDAFSASEQDKIITTLVTADKNPSYDTDPGNDTRDKVFLLSAKEVKELYKSALSGSQDYKAYFYPAKSSRWSFWWTRTPGYYQNFAVYVNSEGETFDFGERVDLRAGVRPAMWVDISALQK